MSSNIFQNSETAWLLLKKLVKIFYSSKKFHCSSYPSFVHKGTKIQKNDTILIYRLFDEIP